MPRKRHVVRSLVAVIHCAIGGAGVIVAAVADGQEAVLHDVVGGVTGRAAGVGAHLPGAAGGVGSVDVCRHDVVLGERFGQGERRGKCLVLEAGGQALQLGQGVDLVGRTRRPRLNHEVHTVAVNPHDAPVSVTLDGRKPQGNVAFGGGEGDAAIGAKQHICQIGREAPEVLQRAPRHRDKPVARLKRDALARSGRKHIEAAGVSGD